MVPYCENFVHEKYFDFIVPEKTQDKKIYIFRTLFSDDGPSGLCQASAVCYR